MIHVGFYVQDLPNVFCRKIFFFFFDVMIPMGVWRADTQSEF